MALTLAYIWIVKKVTRKHFILNCSLHLNPLYKQNRTVLMCHSWESFLKYKCNRIDNYSNLLNKFKQWAYCFFYTMTWYISSFKRKKDSIKIQFVYIYPPFNEFEKTRNTKIVGNRLWLKFDFRPILNWSGKESSKLNSKPRTKAKFWFFFCFDSSNHLRKFHLVK